MTTPTQRVDVARLSELMAKATPGPWTTGEGDPQSILSEHNWTCIAQANTVFVDTADANAALIVAAVNALPAMLQQLAEREAEVEALRHAVERSIDAQRAAERAREEAERLLAKLVAHPYADECQECGIGRSEYFIEATAFLAANVDD